jgi:pSer/pThr/pTyr-binding forkhead associated (FHA) protein
LFLTQGDREFFVSPDSGKLLIGRAPDCHIVLQGNRCSRNHALIDAGKDNYVLLDQSTNGTYVENQYSEVLALSRQSTNLSGSGKLFFGGKSPENVQDIIEYQISTAAPD